MTKTPKLLLLWLATALSFIGFVGGFNIVVDPFGYFGMNSLGYYFTSEHQFKFRLVRGYDYNAIILGDSRIAFSDPSYINLPGYRFVNGGIAGASISELVSLLSASRLDRLKLAVIGLEYGDLGPCDSEVPATEYISWDALRFAVSWTQLGYAINTVEARANDEDPKYHADGTRSIVAKEFGESVFDSKTQRYWGKIQAQTDNGGGDLQPDVGPKCRVLLERARALSDRYGFALLVVFLPRDRDLLTHWRAHSPKANETIKGFLAQVKEVVPYVVDLTNSSFSDSMNFWLDDPTHFRPEVGAQVIEEAIRQSFDTQASK